jgi:hypothetical protein
VDHEDGLDDWWARRKEEEEEEEGRRNYGKEKGRGLISQKKALHATPQPLRRALEGQRDTRVHFVDHEAMALDDWWARRKEERRRRRRREEEEILYTYLSECTMTVIR